MLKSEARRYILDNIHKKSVKELARDLNLKERKIKRFLAEQKKRQKEMRPAKETKTPSFNKKTLFISIILIIILGFSVYGNSLNGKFLWDDDSLVKNNFYIRDCSNIGKLFSGEISTDTTFGEVRFYRPIQMITYLMDYSLWKLDVKGYHLTNILIHILVALSIYWLVSIFFGDSLISLLASLFFIVHPVHAGPVSYISGRSDSLGALFMLLSFIFYIKLVNKEKVSFYILMTLSYIASLLSREASFIMVALVLIYHYSFRKKIKLKNFSSLLVITLIYIILRLTILKGLISSLPISTTFLQRLPGFFVATTNYIKFLVFPFHLFHMEYGTGLFSLLNPRAILGILILFPSLIYAFRKKDNNNLISFSISWFFIALLPVSNIFYPLNAYMADNWLYIPSIGVFIILAKGLTHLYRNKRFQILTVFLMLSLLSTFSYLTIKQNEYFGEPIAFYKRTLGHSPDSPRIYNNLGNAYKDIGNTKEAIVSYKKALELNPDHVKTYNNLGVVYKDIGNTKEAISLYKKALELDPDYIEAYNNIGIAYASIGNTKEAISSYKKALKLKPYYAEAYNNLGITYRDIGNTKEAISSYKKALEVNPDYAEAYYNLGNTYKGINDTKEAISSYKKALKLKPDYAEAYYNLGNTYTNIGNTEEAIFSYKKVLKFNPGHAKAYNNLGNAYTNIDKNEDAVYYYKRALELSPSLSEACNNLSIIYFRERQYSLAIRYCDRAIELGLKVSPQHLENLMPYRE
ncbi:tetratricopeptide repeat protein [Candidatus Omnitrophota bacterium]